MIREKIDNLIKQAMFDKDQPRTEVLRAIKNEFLVYQTAKNAKPLDDAAEIAILNKMMKQRKDSAEQYKQAGRVDLESNEIYEISFINTFLPKKATVEDIENALFEVMLEKGWASIKSGPQIPKKCMGEAIKAAKEKLSNVDGKELSDIVKTYLE